MYGIAIGVYCVKQTICPPYYSSYDGSSSPLTCQRFISDGACANVSSVCPAGYFILQLPSPGIAAICQPWSTCPLNLFEYQVPTVNSDRICAYSSTAGCNVGYFEITPVFEGPSFCVLDRPCATTHYEAVLATLTSGRQCVALSSCNTKYIYIHHTPIYPDLL